MQRRTRNTLIGAALALVVAGTATGAVVAATDDDTPLTGTALQRATQAALEHTGGGEVVETEVGDDGAAYGVEVRLPDGSVVEVSLDPDFRVQGSEADDDAGEDSGEDD